MNNAHWHVLGAGAMGCLFASALQRAGYATSLVLRQGGEATTVPVVVEHKGTSHTTQMPVSTPAGEDRISHLLVTTKAYDVQDAVMSVAHRLDHASQILLLVNGLGFAEKLRKMLPQPRYFYGATTQGAYRIADRHICHAGLGLTRIGRPGVTSPPGWFSQWAQAVQPSTWDPDIEQSLWLKLAINCAINPLTALHRCANGELDRPDLAPQVDRLCEEIVRISAAAGFALITRNLRVQVAEVIGATASNQSSMHQDVAAGRPTEIEYITGHLLSVARRHGIPAPLNEALFMQVVEQSK